MGFCDLPGAGLLCDTVVGGVSDSITNSIGDWIAKSCGDLAKSAVDLANHAVDQTTKIDLGADWFRNNYALILPIALTMIVMTFMLQLIRAAWRRDGQALAQAVTGTISSVFFAMTAITITGVALVVVDALSAGLFSVANTSMPDAVSRLVKISLITQTVPMGWAIPALVALGCAVGAVLYWAMMVFRKVSVLILVVLAPFAAAGGPWEPTRDWRRRWVEATATLVFSKLVMTIIMLVGVSAIGENDTTDSTQALSDIIAGLVVMALVLAAPMMIYKFIHWAGDGQSQDLHRSTAAGLQAASAAAKKGGQMAMSMGSGGAAAGAGMAGSGAGPSQVPGMQSTNAGLDGGGGGGAPEGPSTGALAKAAPTSFRYGAPQRSGEGDGGVSLVSRPSTDRSDGDQGRALVSRAGTTGAPAGPGGSSAPAASGGSNPAAAAHATAGAPGLSTPGSAPSPARAPGLPGAASSPAPAFDPVIAPPSGPAASGAGQRFVFPQRPPSA